MSIARKIGDLIFFLQTSQKYFAAIVFSILGFAFGVKK